ncbi:uncharacterized protein GIQ15_06591 [Arthroderma uncinatum]|uniref:uncharacterized protein n=1 Tax=Arthroderma uncinatum TaxID=74035 RepID=UPI00144A9BEB|nr:uncharacterized protein GIQ15_06591 [Arthroderma uncinatum]KAF3479615.1 hypothetical protein GIQ15_06591 [Arthroderma uncinatum]
MASSIGSSFNPNIPVLRVYNWNRWSQFWKSKLEIYQLWQYVDPSSDSVVDESENPREYRALCDIASSMMDYMDATCQARINSADRQRLHGAGAVREMWKILRDSCDILSRKYETQVVDKFHKEGWRSDDTLATFTHRMRGYWNEMAGADECPSGEGAVVTLITMLPDKYSFLQQRLMRERRFDFLDATDLCLVMAANEEPMGILSLNDGTAGRPQKRPRGLESTS